VVRPVPYRSYSGAYSFCEGARRDNTWIQVGWLVVCGAADLTVEQTSACRPAALTLLLQKALTLQIREQNGSGAAPQETDPLPPNASACCSTVSLPRRLTSTRSRWNRLYSGCSMAAIGERSRGKEHT
jgi:hypothetical protein